jgi:hypothetical protein
MPGRLRISALLIPLAAVAALIVFAAGGIAAPAAHSRRAVGPSAQTAGSGGFSASVSYDQTDAGKMKGKATVGIQGHGTFSAKLRGSAALDAAVIALATGVPVSKIAKGGSYKEQWNSLADGDDQGIIVANFKTHGLGSVCISYVTKHGRFVVGDSFVPASGSLTLVGGTGAAAKWRGSVTYKQNNVSGDSTERFSVTGSEHPSTGAAKGMSAACRSVAKQR